MPVKWKPSKYPGVRYYFHKTRKHGVQKDRYFAIRYQANGTRHEEGLGWASEGWSAEKASHELAELKKAQTTGTGPSRLKEKRAAEEKRKEREKKEREKLDKESITFGQFFSNTYYPVAKTSKKHESYTKENQHFERWIKPVIGKLPLQKIQPFHIEKIKKKMLDAEKSPRMVQYVLATVRQVWNTARNHGIVVADSPTKPVKIPKIDNKRYRFLNRKEAEALLADLQMRDMNTYHMALLSLHCGLRAGEIFNLKWGHVDRERGMLYIVDPKGGTNRTAYMTKQIKFIFKRLIPRENDEYVFLDAKGNKYKEIPYSFRTAVKDSGLNNGVTDSRQKVVFHTLRHTYASWLAESGTDLYTIKNLLGHGSIVMTERYSHLSRGALQNAVKKFDKSSGTTR